ncbi:adenylyl-sulfate kinase [Ferrimonas pelagia]|uniref:Adenylyl-sulfate kinase n=1 Tax=Ferrimonas pelagia TaxID=1177826 RepID=A0ABP9EC78_9GAMM
MTENVVWHRHSVSEQQRRALKGHEPSVLWFTGLSGSGKSTLANALERRLAQMGVHTYLLDGDNVRHGLNRDLGFSDTDRVENIRRIGEVAKLFADAGTLVLTAFISPFRADRALVEQLLPQGQFLEIFVDTPLAECERRDPKGLYQKARTGEIRHFTGIDSDYEPPLAPALRLDTKAQSIEECVEAMVTLLKQRQVL